MQPLRTMVMVIQTHLTTMTQNPSYTKIMVLQSPQFNTSNHIKHIRRPISMVSIDKILCMHFFISTSNSLWPLTLPTYKPFSHDFHPKSISCEKKNSTSFLPISHSSPLSRYFLNYHFLNVFLLSKEKKMKSSIILSHTHTLSQIPPCFISSLRLKSAAWQERLPRNQNNMLHSENKARAKRFKELTAFGSSLSQYLLNVNAHLIQFPGFEFLISLSLPLCHFLFSSLPFLLHLNQFSSIVFHGSFYVIAKKRR